MQSLDVGTRRLLKGAKVVATGRCAVCDSRFCDEPVVAIPDPALPGGYVFVEPRHLEEPDTSSAGI
jgi:hypothetical protein